MCTVSLSLLRKALLLASMTYSPMRWLHMLLWCTAVALFSRMQDVPPMAPLCLSVFPQLSAPSVVTPCTCANHLPLRSCRIAQSAYRLDDKILAHTKAAAGSRHCLVRQARKCACSPSALSWSGGRPPRRRRAADAPLPAAGLLLLLLRRRRLAASVQALVRAAQQQQHAQAQQHEHRALHQPRAAASAQHPLHAGTCRLVSSSAPAPPAPN